ncbi:hypothetical protein VE04_08273 [Pseudogymnoascus sp. 24MN13]|nr:hypothetical protein VE04_08273 [Pseudogymnoascus sp. 24MN13]
MEAITWDIRTSSEETLVRICEEAKKENNLIGDHKQGDSVVKVSDDIAVKFGHRVKASEARTHKFARQHADPSIVHIPRVYRFFERPDPLWDCPTGYLFMEYVPGPTLKELDLDERTDIIPQVAQIIAHLGKIQGGQVPGPIGGGYPEGYLWGEHGANVNFSSVSDLNAWLNKRLVLQDMSIDLGGYPLVLCHLDLCRRNMILRDDNTISLVDWGCAGLYPRFYEVTTLSCLSPYDEPYEDPLIEATTALLGLTEEEKLLMRQLQVARSASLRYRL